MKRASNGGLRADLFFSVAQDGVQADLAVPPVAPAAPAAPQAAPAAPAPPPGGPAPPGPPPPPPWAASKPGF